MSRSSILLRNTSILFIGKFTSQFLILLLIPIYTHHLTTEDYGAIDLLQTIISLFIPILSLKIDSAVFRFLVDSRKNEYQKELIITNIVVILFAGIFSSIIIGLIASLFFHYKYTFSVIINLIILMISSVMMQIQRGLGKNKKYSISCIIIGICTLLLNIIFIMLLKFGAESILWSTSIANFLGILYIISTFNFFQLLKLKSIQKKQIKSLLSFSLPMIPEYLSGWVINVSDRSIISLFFGTALNGIYTVSSKFSNILNTIFTIVNMSWQENAILHINDRDNNEYFSLLCNTIIKVFSTFGLIILVLLSIFYDFIIGSNFYASYEYIPILIYANSWRVLAGVISGIYIALKKSKKIANTTIVAALINLIIHFTLIKNLFLYAACISTLVAYLIMGIYRYMDIKKYIHIKLDWFYMIRFTIIFIITSIIYLKRNFILSSIFAIFIIIYSLIENKTTFKKIYSILFNKFMKKIYQ